MQMTVFCRRAWLWLVIVCHAYGVEVWLSPVTTIVPETTPFIPDIEVSRQNEVNSEKDIDSPTSLATVDNSVSETFKQEITNSGNITKIKVICPSLSSSSSDITQSYNISETNDSAIATSLANSTASSNSNGNSTASSNSKISDYFEDASTRRIDSSSIAKVDLGALEFDLDLEVEVESQNCEHVAVDGGVPHWVERLSFTTSEGSVALQKGWAKGANNLKKLWLRISKGLIIDTSDLYGEDKEGIDTNSENRNGIQKFCSVLPPTLELLDASHTPLGLLHLDVPCSSRLIRLEASHSDLTEVALCAPSLVTLHLSWNFLEGNLDWMTCTGGLAAVEYLQVNQNSLTEVSTCGWSSLRTLDLRRNAISSMDLSTCPSSNLTGVTASHNELITPPILPAALLHLDLNHNQLESLPMITHTLMTAVFSHNSIIEIGKSRFKRARKLLHLSLAYNHIKHLKEHDLNGLRELRTLDVSHNRLREIAGTSLMSLRHLEKLYLHHNHLNTLDSRDLASLAPRVHATLHHNPWHCVCQLLAALQRLQHCPDCQHQTVAVECRERGSVVAAAPFLRSCLHAVQEVTQRLNDESDEDLSEEDDGKGNNSNNKGAVVAVPVLLILIITGAVVAMSYRLYHRHKRAITARLDPIRNRCRLCGLCGCCSPVAMNNGDLNRHRHGELSQIDRDSDTETEL